MTARIPLILLAVAAFIVAPRVFGAGGTIIAKAPEEVTEQSLVIKYASYSGGKTPKSIVGMNMANNRVLNLPVKPEAAETLVETLKELKKGDLIEVTCEISKRRPQVVSLNTYELEPGEDEPGVFRFETKNEAEGRNGAPTITVTRFKQTFTYTLPRKNEKVAAVVDELAADALVQITPNPGGAKTILKTIQPYEPPAVGQYVKWERRKIEKRSLIVVTIKDGEGDEKEFNVQPKTNAAMTPKLRALKTEQTVFYRTLEDDQGIWLVDIKPAPKSASAPASEPSEDEDKSE